MEGGKNQRFICYLVSTYLMLMRYWARATESGLPEIVMVRSVLPPSRSSQFDIRIMAPEICRISAILVPPWFNNFNLTNISNRLMRQNLATKFLDFTAACEKLEFIPYCNGITIT